MSDITPPIKRVKRPVEDYMPLQPVKEPEGFLAKLDRISADAEQRVSDLGLVLDENARRVLRLGVLWAITDKGE